MALSARQRISAFRPQELINVAAAARGGDAAALARIRGSAGFHVSGAAKVALGVAGAVLAPVAIGALPAALAPIATKVLRNGTPPNGGRPVAMPLQTFSAAGGSAGRSASPLGAAAGSLLGLGVEYLQRRFAGPPPRTGGCPPGMINNPLGTGCINLPGGVGQGGGLVVSYGEAVMGRYGAALGPSVTSRQVARCPKGSVLGDDGLCYNKRDLRKDQRKWPPGRKPLLTGGDLNAIAKAARAARRMKGQQRRLEHLGLLKRPKRIVASRGVITKAEAARALRS